MNLFITEIQALINEYGYDDVSNLCIALAIEKFRDMRNYPSTYSEEQILGDVKKNQSKIAMAAIEIDSKVGAEGQTQMSENGISRSYSENIMAYRGVICIVNVL